MIRTYLDEWRKYQIVPPRYESFPGANTFTVVVGKNGTGKSRLLQGVVTAILRDAIGPDAFDREERMGRLRPIRGEVEFSTMPSKVICVSTSPFDKFPLLRRSKSSNRYSYLGLRGLPSQNFSTAYMSRIIASLIRAVVHAPDRLSGIIDVLHYLGYDGVMQCTFSIGMSSRLEEELLSSSDPIKTIENLRATSFPSLDGINLINQLRDADSDDIYNSLSLLRKIKESHRKPRLDVVLDRDGIETGDLHLHDVLSLLITGLAKLRDVSLRKVQMDSKTTEFRLSEASSGEQSVMMGLLGIASQIEDDSLICIDEPEVCLHPEWQERYVHLLLETFSNRRGCQFIIATHSPQIVAELPDSNCFVMSMSDGEAMDAREFSHRSVDFQLASVFRTPGRNNEFLNRTALNLFSRICKEKSFSEKDNETLNFLLGLVDMINHTDPLRDLISAIKKMKSEYGGNK